MGIQLRTPLPTTLLNLSDEGDTLHTTGGGCCGDYGPGRLLLVWTVCSDIKTLFIRSISMENDGELLQSLPSSSAHECMFLCKYREQRASDTDIRQHHGICTRFYYADYPENRQCHLYSGGVYSNFEVDSHDYAGTCV